MYEPAPSLLGELVLRPRSGDEQPGSVREAALLLDQRALRRGASEKRERQVGRGVDARRLEEAVLVRAVAIRLLVDRVEDSLSLQALLVGDPDAVDEGARLGHP